MLAIVLALLAVAAEPPRSGTVMTLFAEDLPRECYQHAAAGHATDKALRVCTRAIAAAGGKRRNKTASIVNRGVVRFHAGEYADAIEDFTLAIERYDHRNARIYVNRALAYERAARGDPHLEALARSDFNKALRYDPANAVAKRHLEELSKPVIERAPREGTVTS